MWYLSFSSLLSLPARLLSRTTGKTAHKMALGLLGGLSFVALPAVSLFPQGASAQGVLVQGVLAQAVLAQDAPSQRDQRVPTARYAAGEAVDLAEIVAEWRGYYEDVPVYQCVCLNGTCRQTEQWPYREFDRYQLSVALGPTNAKVTEAAGFNCFDISDGSRPSDPRTFSAALRERANAADSATESATDSRSLETPRPTVRPTAEPAVTTPVRRPLPSRPSMPSPAGIARSLPEAGVPVATTINNGADIQLDWPSGRSNVVNVTGSSWNVNILNALNCETLSVVAQKMMVAQRVQGDPVVDAATGHVAVPVLLDTCVDVDQMAIFVLDPAEGGGYALYRTQLPPVQGALSPETFSFPNEFSSYAYSTILEMQYWNTALLVRQGSASSAEAINIFRAGPTPAGIYAGCGVVSDREGASTLCDQ